MKLEDLQTHLQAGGFNPGPVDGLWGPKTRAAVLEHLTNPSPRSLSDDDLTEAAESLDVPFSVVKAVVKVESRGTGFKGGRPIILTEPHRFSRSTSGRFDKSHPHISYPAWGTRPYPRSQDARYDVLLEMISLDVFAGYKSASYGLFQILGENYRLCGYENPVEFVEAMVKSERQQLLAFVEFIRARRLVSALRNCSTNPADCEAFCRAYNGPSFRKHGYHLKLANAIGAFS